MARGADKLGDSLLAQAKRAVQGTRLGKLVQGPALELEALRAATEQLEDQRAALTKRDAALQADLARTQQKLAATALRAERLRKELIALRSGAMVYFPKEMVGESECPSCDSSELQVSTYPYSTSPQFSRLVVLWCTSCGMGWVPSVPFDLAAYYGEHYATDNRKDRDVAPEIYFSDDNPLRSTKKGARYFGRAESQIQLARKHVKRIGAMLDFGSGPGYALHKSGADTLHAVEYDDASAKYLSYLGATRLTIDELPEDTYDLVLSSHSLEHVTADNLYDTLAKLRAALTDDGILYVEVPAATLLRYRMVYGHEPHTLFFSPESLKRVLTRAGFDVVLAKTLSKVDTETVDDPLYVPSSDDVFDRSSRGQVTVIARRRKTAPTDVPKITLVPGKIARTFTDRRTDAAKRVTDTHRTSFQHNGFAVFRGLFDTAEARQLATELRQDIGPENIGLSICDALNKVPHARDLLDDPRVLGTMAGLFEAPPKLLQVTDVQTDHNRQNWHRDSACRSFGRADWDESVWPYKVAKIIIYLDGGRCGMGLVPGSHRIATKLGKLDETLSNFDLLRAEDPCPAKLFEGQPKRPLIAEFSAGDALVFDERILHCGRRLTENRDEISDTFVHPKTTLAYVFGVDNRHSWRFYAFFRFMRPELRYRELGDDIVSLMKRLDVMPSFYEKNLFEAHPEEKDEVWQRNKPS